jgi:SAM-dependent methyltransferase
MPSSLDQKAHIHEGHATLERMDGARNYNAWIARQMRPHLGKRVLEVGAGIGTITREIQKGRELVIALEVEPLYVDRLRDIFHNSPHVRPYLSGVELADWQRLQGERLDTVVLSNVLEHIQDDAQAVRNFRLVLQPGGRMVVWVPALPTLFGMLDQAVGHYRRYTERTLRAVVEGNGFHLEHLDWMNLVGIPGWWLNSVLLGRREVPWFQLLAYDAIAPLLASVESRVKLPIGMSLLAVARAV